MSNPSDLKKRFKYEQDPVNVTGTKKPLDEHDTGDCELCGRWSGRLDEGICPTCKTQWRIK
jgi:hypothetical protein